MTHGKQRPAQASDVVSARMLRQHGRWKFGLQRLKGEVQACALLSRRQLSSSPDATCACSCRVADRHAQGGHVWVTGAQDRTACAAARGCAGQAAGRAAAQDRRGRGRAQAPQGAVTSELALPERRKMGSARVAPACQTGFFRCPCTHLQSTFQCMSLGPCMPKPRQEHCTWAHACCRI